MTHSASPVMFGFDFQENVAIVLMIKNIAELKTIKVEGEEDIELLLNDGSYVLAQAKSVVRSSTDFSNIRAKAKKAMESLSEAAQKLPARELIYYTNSPDPLHDDASKSMFYGPARVKYDELPDTTKDIINDFLSEIEKPLDTSLLKIQVLPFETDDDEQKYKVVRDVISAFIRETSILTLVGSHNQLHEVWQTMLKRNGTKSDRKITLNKKDIVWPVIVFVTGKGNLDRNARYCTDLDDGEFDEIERKYGELIQNYCERFETVTKVLSDFSDKRESGRDSIDRFINDYWTAYVDEFGLFTIEGEVKENLTKIVLYSILSKRYDINKIKQFVKL